MVGEIISIIGLTLSINYQEINKTANDIEYPFNEFGVIPQKKAIDVVDGYVYYYTDFYMSSFSDESSLILIHTNASFTPGYTARQNNTKREDGSDYADVRLKRGYIHMTANQYVNGNDYGGDITLKQFWPKSSSVTTTIETTYGQSININGDFDKGVSIGGNGFEAKIDAGLGLGLEFSYIKTISSTSEDPIVSSQQSSSDHNCVQYNFEVLYRETAGKITYNFDTYYLYEVSHESEGVFFESIDFTIEIGLVCEYQVLWWFQETQLYRYRGHFTGFTGFGG